MTKRNTFKPIITALVLALPALSAWAQSNVPNAGSILKQVQPNAAAKPSSAAAAVESSAEKTVAPLAATAPFLVSKIAITGNKKVATEVLHALVADAEGKNLTLAQLDKVIFRITEYYNSHGFPLARAIIPAQTITGGVVNIQVIVANYGKVKLANTSRASDRLLIATLSNLKPGDEIEQAGLDRTLLLLSDLPGVMASGSLAPGAEVGTSDLSVSITPGAVVTGNLIGDNYGNSFTGRVRIGGTVSFVDPLNLKNSDLLSISGLSSGKNMSYGRISYESVINGEGTRLGAAYSNLHYTLGGAVESAKALGNAQVSSLWVKQPLMRSRDINVYAQIQGDGLTLRDHSGDVVFNDRSVKAYTASLSGDFRDDMASGGVTSWNVGLTKGRVTLDNSISLSNDALGLNTQGNFTKWNINASRLQRLYATSSLFVSGVAQLANTNLDSSQKMTVGGANTVRAYDSGAVSGDSGYSLTAELRQDLGSVFDGQLQGIAFIDAANIDINHTPLLSSTVSNTTKLTGAGLGLNWNGANQWNAKAYIATPIGAEPTQDGISKATRAWLEMAKGF
jgi:hemolysin activation/secretion protein